MNILLPILLFFVSVNVQAQNDALSIEAIKINNIIPLGSSLEEVTAAFGAPTSIGSYYSEMDDETWVEYNYQGNLLYFFDTILTGFELKNSLMFLNDISFRAGNNISVLSNLYPDSYAEKGVSGNVGFLTLNILMDDDNISDQFIVVTYDPATNKIMTISTGQR